MKDCRITEAEAARVLIKNANDRPNALATYGEAKKNSNETKDLFDRQFELVKQKHNELNEEVGREIGTMDDRVREAEAVASEAANDAANATDTANSAMEVSNAAKEISDEVKARADRGEFKGDKGDQGERGQPGNDGRTPVKGTDYYTESDKSEMVDRVVAALPKYRGEAVDV